MAYTQGSWSLLIQKHGIKSIVFSITKLTTCISPLNTFKCREDYFFGPCSEEVGVSSRGVNLEREKWEITKWGNRSKSPIQDI